MTRKCCFHSVKLFFLLVYLLLSSRRQPQKKTRNRDARNAQPNQMPGQDFTENWPFLDRTELLRMVDSFVGQVFVQLIA